MEKTILHLTLKNKWFDLIASGEKTIEYREAKQYWLVRLFKDDGNRMLRFDEIHFKNGYQKDTPFMRVEWVGMSFSEDGPGKGPHGEEIHPACYYIKLGKVLEVVR